MKSLAHRMMMMLIEVISGLVVAQIVLQRVTAAFRLALRRLTLF